MRTQNLRFRRQSRCTLGYSRGRKVTVFVLQSRERSSNLNRSNYFFSLFIGIRLHCKTDTRFIISQKSILRK